ncbi:MAG: hypothetical protein JNK53_04340, partial [Phycisphaerae bacterium]|nr:hypothetical protein [Phycisphaerae bacterium]
MMPWTPARLTVALLSLLVAGSAFGQVSTRPGIGAIPYTSGATQYGVTFRVWAPNATSVHVAGTF